ncbi:hypothetical protein ACUNWD_05785 [Sunxiuqinia sp. A32]|uniref:hypothetical protein n=1 Tax=Sunxiuqinia sp. A32 TaxID=3461496 RepID=UPI0040458C6D
MTNKITHIFFSLAMLAAFSLAVVSCDQEDYTGYSNLVPKSPSITITPDFTSPMTLTEDDSKHTITITLSEPQIVDTKLYIKQIDGTASADDYKVTPNVVLPAGSTTATAEIQILSDDLKEEAETLTLQVGDVTTANASLTPATINFTINNLESDDLVIGLSWDTNILDAIEIDLAPTDAIDLRLLITDMDGVILDYADDASFEEFKLPGDWEDGEYLIATDIYSTIDAGDLNAVLTIDATLQFDQIGTINGETLEFPSIMDNQSPCSAYRTVLAKLTKNGASYTFEEAIAQTWNADIATLAGSWSGIDSYDYESQTVTSLAGDKLQITGIFTEWTGDFWAEEIIDMQPVDIEFNWNSSGGFTIPEQYYMTTLYEGDEYAYTIKGSGTFVVCGDSPKMILEFDLLQDGFSLNDYLVGYDYPSFSEEVVLDNGTMKSAIMKSARIATSKVDKSNLIKPNR